MLRCKMVTAPNSAILLHISIPELIENVSSIMRLEEGDVILTGTPKGVGRVLAGETITCELACEGKTLSKLSFPAMDRVRV